jgi:ribosome recycling factor
MDDLRETEKEKLCSQDDARKASEQLQSMTDDLVAKITEAGNAKEADVLEV